MTDLALLRTSEGTVSLRRAVIEDLPSIVELLTDDPLGAARDGTDGADGLQAYVRAFEALDADPAHLLLVAETGGEVVATTQLSFIPGLSRRGALRAQVEGVRVRADLRGSGLGRALLLWTKGEAERRGCALIQLTSDKQRSEAHRFYAGLGFTASHEGFKREL
ncbi:GNAT family N-acetyltransferase [Nocardioides psychrotolerans]|uniref:GNAT family N-acetyltransferase n=1 Tax=Nocardioides psychrotolerans TaxID=1005945 RepID=UPI003137C326